MAADKEDFTERLSAFQKDLNALLDKHQFQELYRRELPTRSQAAND